MQHAVAELDRPRHVAMWRLAGAACERNTRGSCGLSLPSPSLLSFAWTMIETAIDRVANPIASVAVTNAFTLANCASVTSETDSLNTAEVSHAKTRRQASLLLEGLLRLEQRARSLKGGH